MKPKVFAAILLLCLLLLLCACNAAGNGAAPGNMRSAAQPEETASPVVQTPAAAARPTPAIDSDWEKAFLSQADERRRSILNCGTGIHKDKQFIRGETYTGAAYYVSNKGKDSNSGKSPDKAWATVGRIYEEDLKEGDAVFFERGGVWREELQCAEGVTYSAYGAGAKPRFFGSQENGTGEEKWTLWKEGTDGSKIWKYHNGVTDCGGIVFNGGESYASRVYSFWKGDKFYSVEDVSKLFDVASELKNDLQFTCEFDPRALERPDQLDDIDTTGPLYLRCDKGNPGELYSSIEFQTTPHPAAGYCGVIKAPFQSEIGSVLDNLCIMYDSCDGITCHDSCNMVIQNCEVGWVGGTAHQYIDNYVAAAGEGIKMEGSDNVVRNCYIHDCFDGGIISEDEENVWIPYMKNQTIRGNLIERCMSGILIAHKDEASKTPRFGNFTVEDNYILNSGYGWSGDKNYNFTWRSDDYDGTSITFWDLKDVNDGIYVRGNVFYRAKSALVHAGMPKEYQPVFSGNTYALTPEGYVAYWKGHPYPSSSQNGADVVGNILGDKDAKVVLVN